MIARTHLDVHSRVRSTELASVSRRRFSVERETVAGARGPNRTNAFDIWWHDIPRLEGSLDDWRSNPKNAADRGGDTHWGITERAFMGCAGAAKLPKTRAAFEAMTQAEARKIARAIWKTSGAHRIDDPAVAVVVGDWFWGSNTRAWAGIKAALARVGVSVPPGTQLDEATLAAINRLPPKQLVVLFSSERHAQHERIAAADASQRIFLRGWQARVDAREATALSILNREIPSRLVPMHDGAAGIEGTSSASRASAVLQGSPTDALWINGTSQHSVSLGTRGTHPAHDSRHRTGHQGGAEWAWPRVVSVGGRA